jgi:hypothetical protein
MTTIELPTSAGRIVLQDDAIVQLCEMALAVDRARALLKSMELLEASLAIHSALVPLRERFVPMTSRWIDI